MAILLFCLLLSIVAKASSSNDPSQPLLDVKDFYPMDASNTAGSLSWPKECRFTSKLAEGQTVTFKSKNYPSPYQRSSDCEWYFRTHSSNVQLQINCDTFQLRKPWWWSWNKRCATYDNLKIRTSQSSYQRFCYDQKPQNVMSQYQWFHVIFNPSFYGSYRNDHVGFSCTVTAVSTITTTTPEPCKCGRRGHPSETKIVPGKTNQAGLHEIPWQAAIVFKGRRNWLVCGGAVLNNEYIVTVASCEYLPASKSSYEIVLGEHDLSTASDTNNTIYRNISSITMHPNYRGMSGENDIALVKLSSPIDVDASLGIKPICLPKSNRDYANVIATMSGWADSYRYDQSNILLVVDVTTLTHTDCTAKFQNIHSITENILCAVDTRDRHGGDKGGPLVTLNGDHNELIGIFLSGLTSTPDELPNLYVRISKYVDWINANTIGVKTCIEG